MELILANSVYLILGAAGVALIYGLFLSAWILKLPSGDEKMKEIASAIQEGASAYLNKQYQTIGIVALVLFAILWFALGQNTAIGFLVGALASSLAGYIGMNISVRANVKTT